MTGTIRRGKSIARKPRRASWVHVGEDSLQWEPETIMDSIKGANSIVVTNQGQELGMEGELSLNG